MARVVIATAHPHILEHTAHALRSQGHEIVGVLSAGGLPQMASTVGGLGCPQFEMPMLAGELHTGRAMRRDPTFAEHLRAATAGLESLDADFLLGWAISVLPAFLLATARHPINVHPSDLPRYRGGFPLEAQILDGARKFFLSVHHTVPRIDAGEVLARSQPLKIKRSDTMSTLLARSLPVGAALVAGVVTHWRRLPPLSPLPVEDPLPHAWGIRRTTDDQGVVRNQGVLGRLRIEWDVDSARDIARAARAFDSIGGAFTHHGAHLFRITHAHTVHAGGSASVGEVLAVGEGTVDAQARDAVVRMQGHFDTDEGLVVPGDRFGSTELISRLLPFPNVER